VHRTSHTEAIFDLMRNCGTKGAYRRKWRQEPVMCCDKL